MNGVGIHCFAGGFTLGVREVIPVVGQLEIHNFGGDTARAAGIEFMNADSWEAWREYKSKWEGCSFCYGNPRCTSFSSFSSGAGPDVRGPTAKPTQDIWDLCRFGVMAGLDLIAFESVQPCYSVGRLLLDRLRDELFVPNHYRIAHLFVNTAAEGNAQRRRRYFFVAYRDDRQFNVCKPILQERCTTVGDIIGQSHLTGLRCREYPLYGKKHVDYDAGCYTNLSADERSLLPYLEQGQDFNGLGHAYGDKLRDINAAYYKRWCERISDIPFSLHCPTRLRWDGHSPTISSTSSRFIHPLQDRPLTVGEIAALMGWPKGHIPVGPDPVGQIGKGVVPATGSWLAVQIENYFNGTWGDDDFQSSYNAQSGAWRGDTFTGNLEKPIEKVFNLTHYLPSGDNNATESVFHN